MEIRLEHIAKSFGREILFREFSHVFASGSRTALLGPNGCGKSTLLQLVAGALMPTAGRVVHQLNGALLPVEEVYRHVSIAAPYMGMYEELSLREAIAVHRRFKPLRGGIGPEEVARIAYLDQHLQKPVAQFSSGMKQRLKLALAILSDTPLLLLDEPASNLDAEGTAWFHELLAAHGAARTSLVASNDPAAETGPCTERILVHQLTTR